MNKKAQVALEFLTTYGWVIVGVLLLFAVLFYYGSFDPTRFMPNQCNFEQGLQCTTYRFQGATSPTSPTRLILQFSNNFPYDVAFSGNTSDITVENVGNIGKQTYIGNCSPMLPNIAKKNTVITCVFDIYNQSYMPSSGKKIKFQVELNYTNCITDPNYLVNGSCMSGSNYTTKGTVLTPLESNISLTYGYCGDGTCSYPYENPNNCPSDCPAPTTILVSVSPNITAPDGVQYSTATARVRDKNGQAIQGIDVAFISTPIGTVSRYSVTTDESGEASVQVRSNVTGTADVRATSYGVYNFTRLTFLPIPATLLLSAYDSYAGAFCGGSYVIAQVLDSGGAPVNSIPVNFSVNDSRSNMTPQLEISDVSGYAISYLAWNASVGGAMPVPAKVSAAVDLDAYDVHLNTSAIVTFVACQPCGAPWQGDWIIDKTVDCENATITLNGNLNISLDLVYLHKWGDLTFRNVTLYMNSSAAGQRGIYLNRMARFRILDNDNNNATTPDASYIRTYGYPSPPGNPYVFYISPLADTFIMKNSRLEGAGYRAGAGDVTLADITDYRSGLFVNSDNSIIQNNTFSMLQWPDGFVSIILNGSTNSTVTGNVISGNSFTGVALVNSFNNNVSTNSMHTVQTYTLKSFLIQNPAIFLHNAANNTISSNYIIGVPSGEMLPSPPPGPAILLEDGSTGNYIANNYFSGCTYEVFLSSSHQNTFYNNSIFNFQKAFYEIPTMPTQTAGIYATSSWNNTFENNHLLNGSSLTDTFAYQIYLGNSLGNHFINNILGRYIGQDSDDPCGLESYDIFVNSPACEEDIGLEAFPVREARSITCNQPANYFTSNKMYGCTSMKVLWSPNTVVDQVGTNLSAEAKNPTTSFTFVYSPGSNLTYGVDINNVSFQHCGADNYVLRNTLRGINSDHVILVNSSQVTISKNVIDPGACLSLKAAITTINSSVTISDNTLRNFGNVGMFIDNHDYPSLSGSVTNNILSGIGTCPCQESCPSILPYGIITTDASAVEINRNAMDSGTMDPEHPAGGIYFNYSEPIASYNTITTSTGVYCTPGTLPLLLGNNITGSTDNCMNSTNCVVGASGEGGVGGVGGAYKPGDPWTISGAIYCENKNLTVNVSIIITSTGSLMLKNSTFKMAPTSTPAVITVQAGGRLVISDKDGVPKPGTDESKITTDASKNRFIVVVDPPGKSGEPGKPGEEGGQLIIMNSIIQRAGDAGNPGILVRADGAVISGNTFQDGGGYQLLSIEDSSYHNISNNYFADNDEIFILLYDSSHDTIQGNTVDPSTSPSNAIFIYRGSNISISKNTFQGERNAAISMQESSNNSVYGNTFDITSEASRAIDIEVKCDNTRIYSNDFTNRKHDIIPRTALYVDSSSSIIFYNNTLTDATDLSIHASSRNSIYNNTFRSNSVTPAGSGADFVILIDSSQNDLIYNNTFGNSESSWRYVYVGLFDSRNESVSNNTMLVQVSLDPGAGPNGAIFATGCADTNVINNTIYEAHETGSAPAINLQNAGGTIAFNNVTGTSGITLSGVSSTYTIANNSVNNCASHVGDCKCIYTNSSSSSISGNTINCNTGVAGLFIDAAANSQTTLFNNTFIDNSIAVKCNQPPGGCILPCSMTFVLDTFTNNGQNCNGCEPTPCN
ncbi:MAG: right-handed parallel beta-helix repeat-containing protein [Candidatus Micrarchaeota archaeon]|nr:right-handed parallel beta-helix repeat-containing protein [Candidatus Micrarchaeota archaeon]